MLIVEKKKHPFYKLSKANDCLRLRQITAYKLNTILACEATNILLIKIKFNVVSRQVNRL